MNTLTSFQRKLVYLSGVIVLFVPIMLLGSPPAPGTKGGIEPGSGGLLAQMRDRHQLGETNFGQVDPASSTMNLLLLGFRGIATSMLWVDAQKQQSAKDWAGLRATTKSIILLQPHFLKVWHFQGWNLAYNVAAEWDLVPDRYYWVKEGIKFFMEGKDRNEKYPELYWYIGNTIGKKIGIADERAQYRKFFLKDPDTVQYPNGPDPKINPEAKDNFLVARTWFQDSLRVMDSPPRNKQHIMAEILFRHYPQRALMDYAAGLQGDGTFGDVTREAWNDAFREWTEQYGNWRFPCPTGELVKLEVSADELAEIRKQDEGKLRTDQREYWVDFYQNMTHYRFWRTRSKVESEAGMAESREDLYEAERLMFAADYTQAIEKFWNGMSKLEQTFNQFPELLSDDQMLEDALVAQIFWRECLAVDNLVPDESEGYPLQRIWKEAEESGRVVNASEEARRRKQRARQ